MMSLMDSAANNGTEMTLEIAFIIEGANVAPSKVEAVSAVLTPMGFELVRNIGGRSFSASIIKGSYAVATKFAQVASDLIVKNGY